MNNLALFISLLFVSVVCFPDAAAAVAAAKSLSADNSHSDEGARHQFIEKDYISIMTNEVNDQRYLRGRKLQENIDYQKKPYYQSQQPAQGGATKSQLITLGVVVTLTVALAIYALVLHREYAVLTIYNVLGYRLFGDSDESEDQVEEVEIS